MTERQRFVLRAVLIYAQANLGDLNEAFTEPEELSLDEAEISVNGDVDEAVDEAEINQLLMEFQG